MIRTRKVLNRISKKKKKKREELNILNYTITLYKHFINIYYLKQNYYLNLLEKHKDNGQQQWQIMKEIAGKVQKKNQPLLTTLEMENRIISDKNAIAE